MEKTTLTFKEAINLQYIDNLRYLSKCTEGQVSAGLFSMNLNQIFSIGINGGPSKQQDCLCHTGKYGCVHAEQNCLVKNSNSTDAKILICSKQCCQTCASLIVNSNMNIREFWYIDSYKDDTGIKILENAGIKVFKIARDTIYKRLDKLGLNLT